MLNLRDGIADQSARVKDFRDGETGQGALHGNNQAEADRVVVDGTGPAALPALPEMMFLRMP